MEQIGYIQNKRREILARELARRCATNPRYSQRALARDLDVSHTLLSLALNGKREISDELARRLMEISRLPLEEIETLKIGMPLALPDQYEKMELEQFEMISDWTHYAVLSLMNVSGAKWDERWIAKRLGQSVTKVRTVMKRLLELGYIRTLESGRAAQAVPPIAFQNNRSSDAARRFNRRLLSRAVESMESTSFEKRDLSSTVFTLSPQYIPYAIERIRNFRRSLTNELENLGEQTHVYALAVQLFPLEPSSAHQEDV